MSVTSFSTKMFTYFMSMWLLLFWSKQCLSYWKVLHLIWTCSDFVTNSYGQSWDSSCKKIMSPTPERLSLSLKKKWVPGSFVTTQLIWSYTPNFVLQFTEIKIYCFCCKAQQRLKEISAVKQQPQKSHKQDILQKHLQIHQSIFACYGTHTTNCFACLGNFFGSGRRGNKTIDLAIKFCVNFN